MSSEKSCAPRRNDVVSFMLLVTERSLNQGKFCEKTEEKNLNFKISIKFLRFKIHRMKPHY